MSPSDNEVSIRKYRSKAADYDASAEFTMPLRRRAVALLGLKPGDVVLDVGAGTGLSYELLLQGVGPSGRVLAFEQSPDMFALAEARLKRPGWPGLPGSGQHQPPGNIWHQLAPAETVRLPQAPDAVLFNYTHDINRSPQAVANLLDQCRPGARIVVAGIKFFPWWTGPLNLLAWAKNRPYNARPADLWRPWSLIEARCSSFSRQTTQWGMGYIAHGQLHAAARPAAKSAVASVPA